MTAGAVNASTLLAGTSTITVAPGAQIAYGINPTFGGFGHVQYAYASATAGGASQGSSNLQVGGGLSTDLGPVTRIPVGFLAAYNLEVDYPSGGGSSTTSHQISAGVFYTGRPNLSLGVEGSATLQSTTNVNLTIIEVAFGIHYFW